MPSVVDLYYHLRRVGMCRSLVGVCERVRDGVTGELFRECLKMNSNEVRLFAIEKLVDRPVHSDRAVSIYLDGCNFWRPSAHLRTSLTVERERRIFLEFGLAQ